MENKETKIKEENIRELTDEELAQVVGGTDPEENIIPQESPASTIYGFRGSNGVILIT